MIDFVKVWENLNQTIENSGFQPYPDEIEAVIAFAEAQTKGNHMVASLGFSRAVGDIAQYIRIRPDHTITLQASSTGGTIEDVKGQVRALDEMLAFAQAMDHLLKESK